MNYMLPQLRIVIKLFKEMTPEQKASMLKDNHLIFYNFEDVVQVTEMLDASTADARAQLRQAQRQLQELDE